MHGVRGLPDARHPFGPGSAAKLLFAFLALGAAMVLAHPRHAASIRDPGAELAAFPSGEALPVLRMGHAPLAADLAWIRAIQYYGQHRRDDRHYPYAEHLFRTMTGLDPAFEQAYVFGALVVAQDVGEPEAAEALLTRGMSELPDSWWITFERGFLRWIHSDLPMAGAKDFRRASLCPDAPSWVARFAAYGYEKAGARGIAKVLWEQIAEETDNPMVRDIAERALKRIEGEEPPRGGQGMSREGVTR